MGERLEETRENIQLISGGLILSTGLGVAAIYASQRHFVGVFMGFFLFVVGYEISQYSAYNSEDAKAQAFIQDMVESSGLADFFMAVVGLGTVTYGFVNMFRSLEEAHLGLAVISALVMFGGYMMGHYAINKTVL